MLLYVMRHGIAEDPDPSGVGDDAERELTPEGRKKTRRAACGLRALGADFDVIYTSPLARARQTAELVAAEFGLAALLVRQTTSLSPGAAFADLFRDLAAEPPTSNILLVGHEPHLSGLISYLLTGNAESVEITMKKGSVCGVELRGMPPTEPGTLRFLLQPAQLRALSP